jgi:hypothetical protein
VAESGGDLLATVRTTKIGPPLIFDRLWRKRGVDAVLGELLQARKFEFAVERAGCLTARNPGWPRPIVWMSATRGGEIRTRRRWIRLGPSPGSVGGPARLGVRPQEDQNRLLFHTQLAVVNRGAAPRCVESFEGRGKQVEVNLQRAFVAPQQVE